MGKGNLRGSRVGVCAGTGMGSHTVHLLPIPYQTRTRAQVFPRVLYNTTHDTAHAVGICSWAARYVLISAFTRTHIMEVVKQW